MNDTRVFTSVLSSVVHVCIHFRTVHEPLLPTCSRIKPLCYPASEKSAFAIVCFALYPNVNVGPLVLLFLAPKKRLDLTSLFIPLLLL